ncbi:MAG: leucine-rich repeat domain-containing protein [Holosporales bacterium]|nr:leucine-rich repeat domain-containing protein [Holosporales bacterium]
MKKRRIVSALVAFVLGGLSVSSEAMGGPQAEMAQRFSGGDDFLRGQVSVNGMLVASVALVADAPLPVGRALQFSIIPSNVERLGAGCFEGYRSLSRVAFEAGSQLTIIDVNAFQNCSSLLAVCIPSRVETLGARCFADCGSLGSMTFEPNSLLGTVGNRAFTRTHSLIWVHFPNVIASGSYVFDGSGVKEICMGGKPANPARGLHAGTRALQSIEISLDTTEELSISCFANCPSLDDVTFTEGSRPTNIPEYTFCSSTLRSVCIPASVQGIAKASFSCCASLSAITFETNSQLTTMAAEAFRKCSSLLAIHLPSSVETIGPRCFEECRSLVRVTLERDSHLTTLSAYAFHCCKIESFSVPASVEVIGAQCFESCRSLSTVTFETGSRLRGIGERAFYDSGLTAASLPASVTELGTQCFLCQSLSTVTFEEGSQLTVLSECAFRRTKIESIVLPRRVEVLKTECLATCEFLSLVTFETGSQLREIERKAFAESPQAQVVLPDGQTVLAESLYQGWKRPESPALP